MPCLWMGLEKTDSILFLSKIMGITLQSYGVSAQFLLSCKIKLDVYDLQKKDV